MSWKSGQRLFYALAETICDTVSDELTRKILYENFIEIFEDFDCDSFAESSGIDPVLDDVLMESGHMPDFDEYEEEENE